MSALTEVPFTVDEHDGITFLNVAGWRNEVAASVAQRRSESGWPVVLYGLSSGDYVCVFEKHRECAIELAEFHARMCARLVAAEAAS